MQQSSNANVQERVWYAVGEVRSLLTEYERCCAEQVGEAEETARSDRARFAEVCEQLTRERRELAALEEERERLPFAAYRASMDGAVELEAQLRKRHREIKPENLERLRGRIEALAAEAASLGGTARGAEKRAHKNVRAAYASVLRSLQEVEGRIDPLKVAAEELRSKYWTGQRGVEEQLNFLREIEREERRGARGEAAKREEEARRAAAGRGFRG